MRTLHPREINASAIIIEGTLMKSALIVYTPKCIVLKGVTCVQLLITIALHNPSRDVSSPRALSNSFSYVASTNSIYGFPTTNLFRGSF